MKPLLAATVAAAVLAPNATAHDLKPAEKKILQLRLHKSRTVIAWWNGRGHWALATRHKWCWQVRVSTRHRRICRMARASLAAHTARRDRIVRLLTPPRPAAPSVDGCLARLIVLEGSGGDPTATNPVTGAYGIPQALPGSKMASAGADWATNPATQIRWMIGYVNGRYGGSCAALSAWYAQGWY